MEDKLKECSFSPSINESRSPRRFDDFLKEQTKMQKKKEQSITELQKEKSKAEDASVHDMPKINEVCVLLFIKLDLKANS